MSATLVHPIPSAARPLTVDTYVAHEDPTLFKRARTWWTLAALCLMVSGGSFFTKQDSLYYHGHLTQQYSSHPGLLLLTIAMWLMCLGLMFRHMAPTLRTMLHQKPLLAVAVFAFLSTSWSAAPSVTFKRAIGLSLTFCFAWFFATYYPPADQRRMLLATGAILAIASFAWVILLPSYGVASSGEWKGIFGQKNILGLAMSSFFSVLPFCAIPNLRRLRVVAFQAILPLLLIVRSHAREALVLAALFVGVRIFGPILARSRRQQLPFILYATAAGTVWILTAWGVVVSVLGEGAVTSWAGRLQEWSAVVPFIVRHLWFGYGYSGFWTGTGDSLSLMEGLHVILHGSDSGYTDNMLSFGLVGMSILLIVVLASLRDFWRLLRAPPVPLIAFWYVGFILLTWLEAIVGDTFPIPGFAATFIYVVACCGLRNLALRVDPLHRAGS